MSHKTVGNPPRVAYVSQSGRSPAGVAGARVARNFRKKLAISTLISIRKSISFVAQPNELENRKKNRACGAIWPLRGGFVKLSRPAMPATPSDIEPAGYAGQFIDHKAKNSC